MSNSTVTCRLKFGEYEKLNRIKKLKNLKFNADVVRFLIDDYENEDKEIRKLRGLIESLQKKINILEDAISKASFDKVPHQPQVQETNSDHSDLLGAALKILIRLAEANPRACAVLKDEMPELFDI